MRKVKREEVIQALVKDDLDIDSITDREEYIYNILREGFKGFNNYTNKELKQEYEARNWLGTYLNDKIKIIK